MSEFVLTFFGGKFEIWERHICTTRNDQHFPAAIFVGVKFWRHYFASFQCGNPLFSRQRPRERQQHILQQEEVRTNGSNSSSSSSSSSDDKATTITATTTTKASRRVELTLQRLRHSGQHGANSMAGPSSLLSTWCRIPSLRFIHQRNARCGFVLSNQDLHDISPRAISPALVFHTPTRCWWCYCCYCCRYLRRRLRTSSSIRESGGTQQWQ